MSSERFLVGGIASLILGIILNAVGNSVVTEAALILAIGHALVVIGVILLIAAFVVWLVSLV